MAEKSVSSRAIVAFAWRYWRRRRGMGAALLLLLAAATSVDAVLPIYTGRIVDTLVGGGAQDRAALAAALHYLLIFVALSVGQSGLRFVCDWLWNLFAIRNLYDLVTEATALVQRFSADWHANAFAGGTVRKITRGMWAFDSFGDQLFFGLVPASLIMITMTASLLYHLPLVGLFTAAAGVIFCGSSALMSTIWMQPRFRLAAGADTEMGSALADMITGNATIKSFAAEAREDARFHAVATDWRRIAIRAWQTGATAGFFRNTLRVAMMAGMVGITIWLWHQGRATPGDIAFSLTSFFIITGYMRDIGQQISNLQRSSSEMADVIGFQAQGEQIRDAPAAPALRAGAGEIVFDRVSFGYSRQKLLYEDFCLRIAAGEHIALVGPSGAGKTTFAKLIQRLYDVQQGRILIDGQDIALVTQESLRQAVALVPQEPILFHRSLAANIGYGRPEATRAEIEAAARKAYAHDFIASLPQGYDTLVGERGVKLSGGERQRVAIARAMLADAAILLLDEATSSLDSLSEHYIQKALAELVRGRTTVTIAHRLATIRAADRILVFDEGRVVEEGTHAELSARAGSHYKRLYDMQALGLVA